MNLLHSLLGLFKSYTPPPSVRNKRGGLAWIRGIRELNGRIVTTRRLYDGTWWEITPPQEYTAQEYHMGRNGVEAFPGDPVRVTGLADKCLEPIPHVGDLEPSEELEFQPTTPAYTEKARDAV